MAVSFQNLLLTDRLDDHAQREVVVGDHRGRRRLADARAGGVVVRQPQDLHLRHVAGLLEALEFADEPVGPLHVGVVEVVAAELRVELALRVPCTAGLLSAKVPSGFILPLFDPLAIGAVTDLRLDAAVPEVAAGWPGDRVRLPLARVAEDLCGCRDSSAARPSRRSRWRRPPSSIRGRRRRPRRPRRSCRAARTRGRACGGWA